MSWYVALAFVGAALATLLMALPWSGFHEMAQRRAETERLLLEVARALARENDAVISGAEGNAASLAKLPAVRDADPAPCDQALSVAEREIPGLSLVFRADRHGRVVCASQPAAVGAELKERAYFKTVLATGRPVVSGYLISKVSGRPVIVVAVPVGGGVDVDGVVGVTLDLTGLKARQPGLAHWPKSRVSLVERDGTILSRAPDDEDLVGRKFPDHPLTRALAGAREGVVNLPGYGDSPRITAFVETRIPELGHLLVSIPEAAFENEALAGLLPELLVMAAAALAGLLGALLVLRRGVLGPLRALMAGIQRLEKGDYDARLPTRQPIAEFATLATAFNGMAAALLERDAARRALAEVEERLAVMTRSARDGIVIIDDDGRISFWNPAAERIFDLDATDALGRDVHALLGGPAVAVEAGHGMDVFRQTGDGPVLDRTLELTAVRSGGRRFPIELSVSSFRLDARWHAVGVVRDITQRKETELQLGQAQKMEALGGLAGGIAHEVNNFLQPVLALSEAVLEDLPHDSPLREDMGYIQEAAQRIAELVERVLAFAHEGEDEVAPLDLEVVVANVVRALATTAPFDVRLRVDVEHAEEKGPMMARGHARQLETALLNLAENALDALAEVEDRPKTLDIQLKRALIDERMVEAMPALVAGRPYAVVRVKDNGPGIDEATMKRVFDPFFTTKEVGKGTGLGLAIVHKIVAWHGGAVRAHSLPGLGATFELYLPLASAAL